MKKGTVSKISLCPLPILCFLCGKRIKRIAEENKIENCKIIEL